jgi:hypothetical protein
MKQIVKIGLIFFSTLLLFFPSNANVQAVEAKMNRFYQENSKDAITSLKARFGDEVDNWKSEYSLQPFLICT